MGVRTLIFLPILLFSTQTLAALIIFHPNYNGKPTIIPVGTTLLPLCHNPRDPTCINQSSNQAQPLAVHSQEAEQPQYQYFLPAFRPSETVNRNQIKHKDWEVFTPSVQEAKDFQPTSLDKILQGNLAAGRTFLRNVSNPDEIRVLDVNEQGQIIIQAGMVNFVPLNDIQQTEDGNFEAQKETIALPATTKEVQPGCFVIDKPEETEAGFCVECKREGPENNSVLSSMGKNKKFVYNMKGYLSKVTSKSAKKVQAQTVVSGSSIKKICSPEVSLKAIIKNFNRTCPAPYKNNFEGFFKTAYCESCKKGVPPEIMMAMMSIESAGRCPAEARNERENSVGLFQMNAKFHSCRDRQGRTYKRNTAANRQCFKDPINSMNKGIDTLFKHYGQVNPAPPATSQCKSWLEMDPTERDTWRRGVSAYNGGPGWVTRAIESVRNKQTLQSTQYLSGTHKKVIKKHKTDSMSWDELRVAYFAEKLIQKVKKGTTKGATGRRLSLTISNLAHTEAVLGRNVKSAAPGMVEIWSQYQTKFLKKNPSPCTN